jgi:hypothetical protein
MKILVRTFPPSSNPNYGGILQAWALQKVLRDLGHEVWTDSTRSNQPGVLASVSRQGLRRLGAGFRAVGLTDRGEAGAVRRLVDRDVLSFAQRNIREVALYRSPGRVRRGLLGRFDAFVVGSDQVWRPEYVDVSSFLCDFLPGGHSATRVAYAASFGRDDPAEFSADLIKSTTPLARRFDAISVREDSGVAMARTLWQVDAVRAIDPTMLLPPEQYASLFQGPPAASEIVSYVLDATDEKRELVRSIARATGRAAREYYSTPPDSTKLVKSDPRRYSKPRVEEWLRAFSSASFIVTDSYHGTVFSLLFNKPFLVVPNARRGLARFDSLLALFDLQDRVAGLDGHDADRILAPIDWDSVNGRISDEREHGVSFLRNSLRSP